MAELALSNTQAVASGTLKQQPSDFVVTEQLGWEPKPVEIRALC